MPKERSTDVGIGIRGLFHSASDDNIRMAVISFVISISAFLKTVSILEKLVTCLGRNIAQEWVKRRSSPRTNILQAECPRIRETERLHCVEKMTTGKS